MKFKLVKEFQGKQHGGTIKYRFVQGRLRDCAFTSYRDIGKNIDRNLSKEEHFALKNLVKNKDLIIQEAHKGNNK